jgi:hypothetical protein
MRRGFKPSRLSDFSCRQPVSRNSGSQSKINDIDHVGLCCWEVGALDLIRATVARLVFTQARWVCSTLVSSH